LLEGNQLLLRGIELSDVDELMKYWNKKEVKQFLYQIAPHSKEEEEEWIRSTWKQRKKGKGYVFAIIVKEEDLYIGNVEVTIINQISRRGMIGIVIFNPIFWGKGLGTEALELIINFAFNTINLNSLELEVFETNMRARSCYEKVGFKEIGRRRKAHFSEGQLIDMILLDLLKSDNSK
jgi:RimJ/RimL family protein N-acetyltransferase